MARVVDWTVEVSACSWNESGEIEVEDNATDEDIDAAVGQEVFNIVSWGWSERDKVYEAE